MCLLLSTPFAVSLQNHVTVCGTGGARWTVVDDYGPQLRLGPFHRSSPVTFGFSSGEASVPGAERYNLRQYTKNEVAALLVGAASFLMDNLFR